MKIELHRRNKKHRKYDMKLAEHELKILQSQRLELAEVQRLNEEEIRQQQAIRARLELKKTEIIIERQNIEVQIEKQNDWVRRKQSVKNIIPATSSIF